MDAHIDAGYGTRNECKINISTPSSINMSIKTYKKMLFIMNAIEEGWKVYRENDSYIFTKKHEGKKEVFSENYLETFVTDMLI
jgi:hypothetical protein